MKNNDPEVRALKRARNTFRYYMMVLMETKKMNDVRERRKIISALLTVEEEYRNKKKAA